MNNRLRVIIKYKTDGRQKDFAELMGWSPAYLGKLLAGNGNFGLQPVLNVLRKFPEINARWFLLGEGGMFIDDTLGGLRQQTLSHLKEVLEIEKFLPVMTSNELIEYQRMITSHSRHDFGLEARSRWIAEAAERRMRIDDKVNAAIQKSDELCKQETANQ